MLRRHLIVWTMKLFKKLSKAGGKKCWVRILNWDAHQATKVKWDHFVSTHFQVGNRVGKGSILSPISFHFYVNRLSKSFCCSVRAQLGCSSSSTWTLWIVTSQESSDDLLYKWGWTCGFPWFRAWSPVLNIYSRVRCLGHVITDWWRGHSPSMPFVIRASKCIGVEIWLLRRWMSPTVLSACCSPRKRICGQTPRKENPLEIKSFRAEGHRTPCRAPFRPSVCLSVVVSWCVCRGAGGQSWQAPQRDGDHPPHGWDGRLARVHSGAQTSRGLHRRIRLQRHVHRVDPPGSGAARSGRPRLHQPGSRQWAGPRGGAPPPFPWLQAVPRQLVQEEGSGALPGGTPGQRGRVRADILRGGWWERPLPDLVPQERWRGDAEAGIHFGKAAGSTCKPARQPLSESESHSLEHWGRHPPGAKSKLARIVFHNLTRWFDMQLSIWFRFPRYFLTKP